MCLPCCGLDRSEGDVADCLGFSRSWVQCGESLFRIGDRFTSLYAVRRGFFKSTAVLESGRRDQVTGFSMTGEILGIDGIGRERHTCNAIALEDSEVCAIAFAGLQDLAQTIPSLQRQVHTLMSREIERGHAVMLLLGSMNAEERLALFLLNLSQRFATRGCSPSTLNLCMKREEIGSYLGLTLETVSRTFSQFREQGLIDVRSKFIHILDSAALERVVGRDMGLTAAVATGTRCIRQKHSSQT